MVSERFVKNSLPKVANARIGGTLGIMFDEMLFPAARLVLDEAIARHGGVLAYAQESIALAHHAYHRQRDMVTHLVPGIPNIRRIRNDINDDCWRFFQSIGDPLIDMGLITDFAESDGGGILILPNGLRMRIKKGDANGNTANYPTEKISQMDVGGSRWSLYPSATELDQFILDGHGLDIVFVVGQSKTTYELIGIKFSAASISPFAVLTPPTSAQLATISPAAHNLVVDARNRLTA